MLVPRPVLRDRFLSGIPFVVVAVWSTIRAVELRAGTGIGALVDRPELWSFLWFVAAGAALVAGVGAFSAKPWRLAGAMVVETVVVGWLVDVWLELGWSAAGSLSTFVVVAVLLAQSWARTPVARGHR